MLIIKLQLRFEELLGGTSFGLAKLLGEVCVVTITNSAAQQHEHECVDTTTRLDNYPHCRRLIDL